MTEWDVVVPARARLGEGPVWVTDRLWWVDILAGRVHRTDPVTGADQVVEMGEEVGSVIPRARGGWLCGVTDGVAFFAEDGTEQRRILVEADDHEARMNDAKCDPAGRLYTGTMTHGEARSALYRLDPDDTLTTVFTGIHISNGLGWSPSGDRMYYIDTLALRVDAMAYDPATGEIGARTPLVVAEEGWGAPDGMCTDAEGCLWVAWWNGGAVRRFAPTGELLRTVELPAPNVTSCAFGGPDLDQLFITTATDQLDDTQLAEHPLAGHLFRIDPGVAGQPVAAFPA